MPPDQPDTEKSSAVDPAASTPSSGAATVPLVSIVMPIRNEAGFIAAGLDQILAQDYPQDRLEILVADGMSDDGTRDILADYQRRCPQIVVIDNPGRIVSTGINAAIERIRGEIVLRIDGHVEVAHDFVRQSVQLLADHPEAWSAGGPIVHVGKTLFGSAVAEAMSHRVGVGNAGHRFANYEGYGEGTAFPAFRRWVFDRIGLFDERLIRNQDDEFNFRIVQAGGKVYISPKVRYRYFVRDRIDRLFKQYFQYSFWRIPMIRKHRRPTTVRQLIPPLFYLLMFALLVAGLLLRRPLLAFGLPVAYLIALAGIGLSLVPRIGWKTAALVPVAIATMHCAYALGWIYGIAALLVHPHAWDPRGSMAKLSR